MNNPHFGGLDLVILYPLLAIYKALLFVHIPYALGFSIILLTILIRFLLYPLISSQIKASKKMQELNPHLQKIKETHKGNSTMISQETMRLYKEHGVNPASGCLPVLIQLPVIFTLYSVLQNIIKAPDLVTLAINKVIQVDFLKLSGRIDQTFFGLPLGKTPWELTPHPLGLNLALLILLIPIATGVFQYIQSKMMFPKKPKEEGEVKKSDDFASIFATQSTYIFPIMIGFFSATFPIGLSLYWNTFTIFGIIQQYKITGNPWQKQLK